MKFTLSGQLMLNFNLVVVKGHVFDIRIKVHFLDGCGVRFVRVQGRVVDLISVLCKYF